MQCSQVLGILIHCIVIRYYYYPLFTWAKRGEVVRTSGPTGGIFYTYHHPSLLLLAAQGHTAIRWQVRI